MLDLIREKEVILHSSYKGLDSMYWRTTWDSDGAWSKWPECRTYERRGECSLFWEHLTQILNLSPYHKFQRWCSLSARMAARNMKKPWPRLVQRPSHP